MLSSRDGYCTIVVFDEILAAHHVQQQTLQFQSIAHNHSVPLTSSSALTPSTTPALSTISLPPTLSPRISSMGLALMTTLTGRSDCARLIGIEMSVVGHGAQ